MAGCPGGRLRSWLSGFAALGLHDWLSGWVDGWMSGWVAGLLTGRGLDDGGKGERYSGPWVPLSQTECYGASAILAYQLTAFRVFGSPACGPALSLRTISSCYF